MSQEQANTFRKFRDAEDAMGNLGWASKMSRNGLMQAVEAPSDIEQAFGFSDREKVVWRLLKIPRKYSDIETCGVIPAEKIRGFLRGLVSADVLDMVEGAKARPLVPLEISREARNVKGQSAAAPVAKKSLQERVFRPDIGLEGSIPPVPTVAPRPRAAEPEAKKEPAKKVLSGKDWELKKKIDAAFDAMAEQNHYAFLGLKQGAPETAIKEAGLRLAREYHPDSLAGTDLAQNDEVKGKLDALFKRLQDVRTIMNNPEKRAGYDSQIDAGGSGGVPQKAGSKVRRPQEAQVTFTKAETFFRKKDYANAEKHYLLTVEFDWENPRYQIALAFCTFLNEAHEKGKRTEAAKKRLRTVIEEHKHADAAYKLGLIARLEGNEDEAQKRFREALRMDPNHKEAAAEKRVADRRKSSGDDDKNKKGMLGFLKR